MYAQRNIEMRSRCHFCNEKLIRITYSLCVSVVLVILHTIRMRHIAICGLSGSTTFFSNYLISGTIFEKKKKL